MSDASTRSGSPSGSHSSSEAAASRRGSKDSADLDRTTGAVEAQVPASIGTPPRPAPAVAKDVKPCPLLAFTSPSSKPCPLSPTAIGDASQRQPMSRLGTPVASPSKGHSSGYAPFGGRLVLPTGGLLSEPFQSSPAGTPSATPVASRYTVTSTSPGMASGAVLGDASARTPGASPMASQNAALTSWLCGSPCNRLPSGPELTELLRKALPEAYED